METIAIPKMVFNKILSDVEILINDVEIALDAKVQQRIQQIDSGKIKGKTEEKYHDYAIKNFIKFKTI